MAYKNQKKNKKHIKELQKKPHGWRMRNKQNREESRIRERNDFLKELRKKYFYMD